jgi:hypothetical protein
MNAQYFPIVSFFIYKCMKTKYVNFVGFPGELVPATIVLELCRIQGGTIGTDKVGQSSGLAYP